MRHTANITLKLQIRILDLMCKYLNFSKAMMVRIFPQIVIVKMTAPTLILTTSMRSWYCSKNETILICCPKSPFNKEYFPRYNSVGFQDIITISIK